MNNTFIAMKIDPPYVAGLNIPFPQKFHKFDHTVCAKTVFANFTFLFDQVIKVDFQQQLSFFSFSLFGLALLG